MWTNVVYRLDDRWGKPLQPFNGYPVRQRIEGVKMQQVESIAPHNPPPLALRSKAVQARSPGLLRDRRSIAGGGRLRIKVKSPEGNGSSCRPKRSEMLCTDRSIPSEREPPRTTRPPLRCRKAHTSRRSSRVPHYEVAKALP